MSELIRIRDETGRDLDASFAVEDLDGHTTVHYASPGGTTAGGNARNKEYNAGLDLLLARLGESRATLTDAVVESRTTRDLSHEERRLDVRDHPYPIHLDSVGDVVEFRRTLCREQRGVGNGDHRTPGSGNNQRSMRLFVALPTAGSPILLAAELAGGPLHSAPIELVLVDSAAQVRGSLRTFNFEASENHARLARLLTSTEYCTTSGAATLPQRSSPVSGTWTLEGTTMLRSGILPSSTGTARVSPSKGQRPTSSVTSRI